MFDRIFSGILAFGVLAAATMAIGTALFETPARAAPAVRVEVVAPRAAPAQAVAQCDSDAPSALR